MKKKSGLALAIGLLAGVAALWIIKPPQRAKEYWESRTTPKVVGELMTGTSWVPVQWVERLPDGIRVKTMNGEEVYVQGSYRFRAR